MNSKDINALVTKWQLQMLLISAGQFSNEGAKEIINNIIDEIVENREPIANGELSIANNTLLFTNILFFGSNYNANIGKLSFLAI